MIPIIDEFKDTHREKAPSNKTQALTKSINVDILLVSKLNQLFIRGSYTESLVPLFRGIYVPSDGLKMKPVRLGVFLC